MNSCKRCDFYGGNCKPESNDQFKTPACPQKRIMEYGAMSCPFCGSTSIQVEHMESECGEAWRDVLCLECNCQWTELYKLTGMTEIMP